MANRAYQFLISSHWLFHPLDWASLKNPTATGGHTSWLTSPIHWKDSSKNRRNSTASCTRSQMRFATLLANWPSWCSHYQLPRWKRSTSTIEVSQFWSWYSNNKVSLTRAFCCYFWVMKLEITFLSFSVK